MTDKKLPQPYPCKECMVGVMHPHYVTYFTWLGSELITVPNFPSWICDVCGRREYDQGAVAWLSTLLTPDAGRPVNLRGAQPHSSAHKQDTTSPLTE